MPYHHKQMIMEISSKQKVVDIKAILIKEYQSQPKPIYFYLPEYQSILEDQLTLEEQGIRNGDIIYWL